MRTMINRLKADHERIRRIVAALLHETEGEVPRNMCALSRYRWQLTREVLQHLPVEDRAIYLPLSTLPSSGTTRAAMVELDTLYGDFKTHVEHWTAERVAVNWTDYRAAVGPLARRLLARMEREERELYPLAQALKAGAMPPQGQTTGIPARLNLFKKPG